MEAHLASALDAELQAASENGLVLALSAKAAFSVEWEKFLFPAQGQEGEPLVLPIVLERFAYPLRSRQPRVTGVRTIFVVEDDASGVFSGLPATNAMLTPPGGGAGQTIALSLVGTNVDGDVTLAGPPVPVGDDPWTLAVDTLTIDQPERVRDLLVLVDFDLGG